MIYVVIEVMFHDSSVVVKKWKEYVLLKFIVKIKVEMNFVFDFV